MKGRGLPFKEREKGDLRQREEHVRRPYPHGLVRAARAAEHRA